MAYKAEIISASKELSPRERLKCYDFDTMTKVNDLETGTVFKIENTAKVHVVNDALDNPEYMVYVYISDDGMYYTSSESFNQRIEMYYDELVIDGGEKSFDVKVIRKESKKGNDMLLASLV